LKQKYEPKGDISTIVIAAVPSIRTWTSNLIANY